MKSRKLMGLCATLLCAVPNLATAGNGRPITGPNDHRCSVLQEHPDFANGVQELSEQSFTILLQYTDSVGRIAEHLRANPQDVSAIELLGKVSKDLREAIHAAERRANFAQEVHEAQLTCPSR